MRRRTWFGLAVGLVLLAAASGARTGETNPYLMGSWEDDGETIYTDFVIVNPTTIALDVYAAFYDNMGAFIPGKCFKKRVGPNGKWNLSGVALGLGEIDATGTAKFIALPGGSTRKTPDTNAIIAGYQNRWVFEMTSSQAELRGVDLVLSTLGEFTNILNRTCTSLEPPK